jgi:hypothetical protein
MSAFCPIADITGIGQFWHSTMQNVEPQERTDRTGIGCALAVLGFNALLIGFVAASYMQGPYSSDGQKLWYRYGSLAFFVVGAVVPAIAIIAARRSRRVLGFSVALMAATLVAFVWYVGMSGGGV